MQHILSVLQQVRSLRLWCASGLEHCSKLDTGTQELEPNPLLNTVQSWQS